MDQSVALNALAPYLALAKSATSPRAAADLIAQATSAQNTYVFAELMRQPNIQALKDQEQFGGSYELLKIFAWGTWEDYKGRLWSLREIHVLQSRLLTGHCSNARPT
jgi:COP9 signalosome complex subunit 7